MKESSGGIVSLVDVDNTLLDNDRVQADLHQWLLIDHPFADRLYPGALDALERLSGFGPTEIPSVGDVVPEAARR